ncbi:MAG: hypothetical protein QG582_1383 [Candidatus Thermoplasmatota archaeon]|nr:hypothetical protein [Candidatus Thermoplasmatota archaeon]
MRRSLENGLKVHDVFGVVQSIRREGHEQPIVLMTCTDSVDSESKQDNP